MAAILNEVMLASELDIANCTYTPHERFRAVCIPDPIAQAVATARLVEWIRKRSRRSCLRFKYSKV
jgi:hypothetical protein